MLIGLRGSPAAAAQQPPPRSRLPLAAALRKASPRTRQWYQSEWQCERPPSSARPRCTWKTRPPHDKLAALAKTAGKLAGGNSGAGGGHLGRGAQQPQAARGGS
eukprot:914551-Pyramimonas_sp.AAC.1